MQHHMFLKEEHHLRLEIQKRLRTIKITQLLQNLFQSIVKQLKIDLLLSQITIIILSNPMRRTRIFLSSANLHKGQNNQTFLAVLIFIHTSLIIKKLIIRWNRRFQTLRKRILV